MGAFHPLYLFEVQYLLSDALKEIKLEHHHPCVELSLRPLCDQNIDRKRKVT